MPVNIVIIVLVVYVVAVAVVVVIVLVCRDIHKELCHHIPDVRKYALK